jgi:hypothetical protein
MSKLYIFGDSYSTPGFCVDLNDSWWGLMATDLSDKIEKVDNYSWPGNNIDSIQHIIVANRDIFRWDDYVVIGVPPIERLTIYEQDSHPNQVIKFSVTLDELSRSVVPRHDGLKQLTQHQVGKDAVKIWNRSWQEAQILRQLITLASWLDTIVENYFIVNLSEPFQPLTQWSTLNSLQQQVLDHPRMLIFSDTYYSFNKNIVKPADFDTHGWFGHYGADGNRRWYEKVIKSRIQKLGWIR